MYAMYVCFLIGAIVFWKLKYNQYILSYIHIYFHSKPHQWTRAELQLWRPFLFSDSSQYI